MPKIKKIYDKGFTTQCNVLIEDTRPTWKAKGIFQYLWSRPDDWVYYQEEVATHAADGVKSLRSGLKELEKYGYLKRSRVRENGKFKEPIWELCEDPEKAEKIRKASKKPNNSAILPKGQKGILVESPGNSAISPKGQKGILVRNPGKSTFSPKGRNGTLLNTNLNQTVGSSKYAASKAAQTDEQILAKQAYDLWNDIWGKPSLFVKKQISQWVNEFGIDVVAHAFNYAKWKVEQASAAGSYLAKVFDNYRQNNVQTASQATEADAMNLHRSKLSQRAKQSDSTTTPSKGKSSRKDDLKNLIKDEPEAICYRAARLAKINLSGADQQALNEFVRRLGPKLVLNAIEVAKQETRYQYPSWGFLRSILRRYEAQGIKTVEDVKSDDSNMLSKGNSKRYKRHKPIKEPMPEWSRKSKEELYKKADPEAIRKLKERIANRNKRRKEVSG
ncbi:DnaD domain protein [Limosilactobacillus reuteri]|uniref:DnaD domain protein n=1 Tax=Limosilactobacillus reuteri TaxID=1598 RepID=UPI001E4424E6|nr:DnaD domain protein [Limosilactobacillus reuteri]MCC4350130.1 DnaD domain protein [Limosilactobacillus reuteri]MCC4361252.1 DnaD domain protein [Limosilactobacillus reuteri]MCC4379858.1 DnaD domain protein [Limosilactobacillus reuteri]MCC4408148.1 DnaD domain protein [Limosilactobacillus reuteri]MCC4414905.1 DnaD domain protein [Limosilactobacillus reuteri]